MFLEIQIELSTRKSILLLTIHSRVKILIFDSESNRDIKNVFFRHIFIFFFQKSIVQSKVCLSQKKLKVDNCMKRYFLHQLSNFDSKIGFDIKNIFLNMKNQNHFLSLLVLFSQKKFFTLSEIISYKMVYYYYC